MNLSKSLVVISFSSIDLDARTLNLIRYAAPHFDKIYYIGLKYHSSINLPHNISTKYLDIPKKLPFILRYKYFHFLAKSYLSNLNADIIWAADLFSLPAACSHKKKFNSKLIYDSREIYSSLGPLKGRGLMQKYISYIENKYIHYANEVFASGELDCSFLQEKYSIKKVHLLLNLPPKFTPKKSNLLREKYNIPNEKKIIIYQGAILKGRGLDFLIDFMQFQTNFVLFIFGDAASREIIEKLQSPNLVSLIYYVGSVPYDELLQYTQSADIGVALFEPLSISYNYAFPNKLFEYVNSHIPVLVSDLLMMKSFVDKYRVGEVVKYPFVFDDVKDKLIKLSFNANVEYYKQNCAFASETFNYDYQFSEILKVIIE